MPMVYWIDILTNKYSILLAKVEYSRLKSDENGTGKP